MSEPWLFIDPWRYKGQYLVSDSEGEQVAEIMVTNEGLEVRNLLEGSTLKIVPALNKILIQFEK